MAPTKRSRDEWYQEIIATLAQQKALGDESVSVKKLKTLCQYPGGEASFKNNIVGKLKNEKKAVDYPERGHVGLTETGDALAEKLGANTKKHTTNEDVQQHLKETILKNKKSFVEVFDFLVQDGKPHTYDEVAKACSGDYDPTSLSFSNNIMSKMRSCGIIETVDKSSKSKAEWTVQLTDMCFPFGRP